ncbi:MAG TPA: hypothetical protein VLM36_04275 [Sphingomicrobium sp.]|nr:hypothetical protein [Sphingomicrobium sp.]
MRKFLISLAAAGAALAAATPAAAQYYPQSYGQGGYPQSYGYGANGYGYGNFGEVRALQARIDAVEHQIRILDRRDLIRGESADRMKDEAMRIESRLHRVARNGLNGYEANDIQMRIARLEQRVQYASAYRYGRDGRGYGDYGYQGRDGDRDGRGYDRNDD